MFLQKTMDLILWTAGWAIFLEVMITSWVQVYVSKEKLAEQR